MDDSRSNHLRAKAAGRLAFASGTLAVAIIVSCSGNSAGTGDGGSKPTSDVFAGDGSEGEAMVEAGFADQAVPDAVTSAKEAGSPEASGTEAATTEGGPDGGSCPMGIAQCNVPTVCGAPVVTKETVGTAPAPQGGPIIAGLYFLTDENVYRTAAGGATPTYQIAIELGGATFAEASYQGGAQQSPIAGTYSTTGTTLNRTITCGGSGADVNPYSAPTGSTLKIYRTVAGDGTYELVLTRQ